jgi:hypothetical protein
MSEAMATLSQKMPEVEAELREAKRAGRQDASKLAEYRYRETIGSLQEEVNWFDGEYAKLEKEYAAEKEARVQSDEAAPAWCPASRCSRSTSSKCKSCLQQQVQSQGQELSAAKPSRIRSLQLQTSQGMHKANTEKKLRKKLAATAEEQAHQTKRRSAKRRGVIQDQRGVIAKQKEAIAKQKEAIKLLQRRMTEQDARVDSAVTGHGAAVEELGIFRSVLQGVLLKAVVMCLCVVLCVAFIPVA